MAPLSPSLRVTLARLVTGGPSVPDFTVATVGTDSSGRAVLTTAYMRTWWESVVVDLGFRPVIVQGAFMSRVPGGGAQDSAGYHDLGGCLDLRTWDLTADESERLVRTLRRRGAAAWRRDERHGMDPHLHFVLGTDQPLAPGAAGQWRDYIAGHDGLAGNGSDYEWRPSPLVLTPPEDDVSPEDIDAIAEKVAAKVLAATVDKNGTTTVKQVLNKVKTFIERQRS